MFESLRRRGIAHAFADIIRRQVHERYLQDLFAHLRNEPPAGYNKPTLQQVLKASGQVFLKLIQDDIPVRRDALNVLALDAEFPTALSSYEVGFHLLPLQKPLQPNPGKGDHYWQKGDWHRSGGKPCKGKPKGKGKGKSKGRLNILPKELQRKDNVSTDLYGRRWLPQLRLSSRKIPQRGLCPLSRTRSRVH